MTTVPSHHPLMGEHKSRKTWQVGSLTYTAGGLAVVFCWLIWGDLAWAVRDRAVPPVMQLLFKKFGASDLVTGLIFSSLPAALGLVLGPIVSYKSDRLRSRWGRRIPYLIIPVPFIVVSTIGLACSPTWGEGFSRLLGSWSPGASGAVVILLGLFWTIFEVACVITGTVFGALINDVVPQEVIGRFYGLFRAASLVTGILFFYNLNENAENHYTWIFLGVAALYGIGFCLMCFNVKEGVYPPLEDRSRPGLLSAVRTYFRDGFGNSYYLWFFAAMAMCGLAGLPFNLYSVFYAKSIGMDLGIYFKCLALTYVFSLVFSYPLGSLADKFHPLRVTMIALALYALIMVCCGLFVRDSFTFAVALVAHGVIIGTVNTAMASLSQRILPRDRFAEIGSAGGIISSISSILLPPILGLFLDHVHHAYRVTFFASAAISCLSVGAFVVVHRRFVLLGGPSHYSAPQ